MALQAGSIFAIGVQETRQRAGNWKDRPRVPGQIVCVSAMAPHKNVETLIQAFKKLKRGKPENLKKETRLSEAESSDQNCSIAAFQNSKISDAVSPELQAPVSDLRPLTSDQLETRNSPLPTSNIKPPTSRLSLHLVGSWPDAVYEQKILCLITDLGLREQVQVHGFVSREELDRLYAESQVFCLMSRCESFGIPAIEAQLFGTPVVCSTACAVPEICGEGGLFCDPDDVDGIAAALESMLCDPEKWNSLSERARFNGEKYVWEKCSRPLVELFRDQEKR